MDDILCVVVRLSCFNSGFYFEMWHCDSNDTDVFLYAKSEKGWQINHSACGRK